MTAARDAPRRIETATDAEAGRLIALVEAFHGNEHPLTPAQREAIRALLRDPSLGRAWLLAGDLGYATCLFAHSIDAGGRVAILDDLYVVPGARGRGLGVRFLAEIEADLARSGVRAMSLHADRTDARAVRLYRGRGFAESPLVTFEKALGEAPRRDESPSSEVPSAGSLLRDAGEPALVPPVEPKDDPSSVRRARPFHSVPPCGGG